CGGRAGCAGRAPAGKAGVWWWRGGGGLVDAPGGGLADPLAGGRPGVRACCPDLGLWRRRSRQRLTIGAHELVATDESGECNRFAAGLAEIVPDLAVSIAV